jgi:3-carboxy-cis,cis-muconate cycloisomerase
MSRRLIDSLTTTDALASLFADDSVLQAMLDFEVALARAETRCGVIPENAAAFQAADFDTAAIAREGRSQATVAIPFVRTLTARAPFAHWGATSQDVLDTAMVLLLRRAHVIFAEDHKRLTADLRELSEEHAASVMVGRTLLQSAPPVTFGLKTAGWFAATQRNWHRLDTAFRDANVLQFGGASGTLACLGSRGLEVSRTLAEELNLNLPDAPWHAHRDRLAAVVTNCGIYTGTLGKIARDIALLMQQEIGEAEESGGGSSTMPHKRNPSSCAVALANANRVPGLVASFLAGMSQEHERAVGGMQAEWSTIADVIEGTGAALSAVRHAVENLKVYPEKMRANIAATRGLIFTEKITMIVGARLGRETAHQLLSGIARRVVEEDITLTEAVRTLLTPEEIEGLEVPEDYLGAAEMFRKRLLSQEK